MENNDHLDFQKSIQQLFIKSNRNRHDEIVTALETGNIKQAYILAHNIKSNSGHLGKTLLQQAAEEIEHSLKKGENLVTPKQLAVLKTELDAALADFEANLASSAEEQCEGKPKGHSEFADQSGAGQEELDEDSVRELFEKLNPMLKSGNPECLQFTDRLRLIPGSEELIQQLTDLDFEQSVFTLAELREKLAQEKKATKP